MIIRNYELLRATKRCEYCRSSIGLTVHRVWCYDYERRLQRLTGFKVSCQACSLVTHMGFASVRGLDEYAVKHFMEVNGINRKKG